jgi:ornithine cyclodeaminase
MSVYVEDDDPIAGVKWIGSHPENFKLGLERANAIIILNDARTNIPIAIVSASLLSAMRTMAVGLIAIDRFKPNPKIVACIGMGRLGRLFTKFIPQLYPSVEKIVCFSERANFADLLESPLVERSQTYQEAIEGADVVITVTSASEPYILPSEVTGAKLLINLSLMDYDLDVYLKADSIVVDDFRQCANAKKVFKTGVEQGLITRATVYELSEALFGEAREQPFSGQIIVNPIGMAIEDMVVARTIFNQVKKEGTASYLTIS